MTVLKRLYASGGPEMQIVTLEINDGVTTHYLTRGWDDIEATLETGETVTFIACGMDVALPKRNADGTQDLKFALCNVSGEISAFIADVLQNRRQCQVIYRTYLDIDLSAPAEPPYRFIVKSGQWTATQADIVAGYFDLLSTGWPRRTYNLIDFPGLRYL